MTTEGNPDVNISEHKDVQEQDNGSGEESEFKVPLPAKVKMSKSKGGRSWFMDCTKSCDLLRENGWLFQRRKFGYMANEQFCSGSLDV